jgi:hypothetical protein
MALSSIYAAAQIAGDPFLEPKDNAGSIYAGFIIGGAVVGGVIGAASPKWKAMSLPKNQKENQVSYYLAPGYNSQTKSVSLKLSLTF